MFIFVGCAGGGTSSMFCQRMVKEITTHDPNLRAVFDDVQSVAKKRCAYGANYDLIFAYGGASAIRDYTAFEFGKLFDVIYVAPQVRFLTAGIRELLQGYPTAVKDIPMKIFGRMDAPKAYGDLLDDLVILDEQRGYQSSLDSASKGLDKNPEILMVGTSRDDPLIRQLLTQLTNLGLRCLAEKFTLTALYQDRFGEAFDLRFLFAVNNDLNQEDFPRIARRIDGLIVLNPTRSLSSQKQSWLEESHIPFLLPAVKGEEQATIDEILDFLLQVQFFSEQTSEFSVETLEVRQVPKRKNFLGIISWQETLK